MLRVKCRYMSLVCINVTQHFFSRVVFFPADFSAGQQTCLVAWTTSTPLDRFAVRLKKWLAKKLHDRKTFWLHLCKLEICTYISLAAIYGLTAITKILVAGWKHASFLCYSMGARWFLRFLGPKLELPSMSAYSPYLRRLCVRQLCTIALLLCATVYLAHCLYVPYAIQPSLGCNKRFSIL